VGLQRPCGGRAPLSSPNACVKSWRVREHRVCRVADCNSVCRRTNQCATASRQHGALAPPAGEGLCALLASAGDAAAAAAACQAATRADEGAVWAWRRLAFLRLAGGDAEAAVPCFHTALRAQPGHARTWEGLGAAYQALGRLTAALKARACRQGDRG